MGFDALHLSGQSFGHPRPVVNFTVRVLERDVGVWIDDAGHPEVLVDALSASLILGLHATGDFEAVFLHLAVGEFPELPTFVGFRRLVLASVQPDVDDGR